MLSPRRRTGERGAILVLVAPLFVAIFAITSLVIDIGNARQEARHVQGAVDAASLAGARELPLASASTGAANRAKEQAAKNVNTNITASSVIPAAQPDCSAFDAVPANSTCYAIGDADVAVATPYLDAPVGAPEPFNLVFVRVCRPTATFFARTIGAASPEVCREAVGRRVSDTGGYPMGLVVIDEHACPALIFSGSSTTQLSSNGAVMVNSDCTDASTGALDASGQAWRLDAAFVGVVGTANLAPCQPPSVCSSTEPTMNIDHFDDPFDHIEPPNPVPANSPTHNCAPVSGTRVLEPGRYPNGCAFSNSNTTDGYIFRPGTYYFDSDAGLSVSGNVSLVCDATATTLPVTNPNCDDGTKNGVTFIVATGPVKLNGTASVHLPSPTTGDYAGVSIYQISDDPSQINGTSDFLLGSIYAPDAYYLFSGNGGNTDPKAVNIEGLVVTERAELNGNFRFDIQVPAQSPEAKLEDDFGLWK